MTEQLIIVNIIDGIADTRRVHIPAPEKTYGGHNQIVITFNSRRFPPQDWPSLCGTIPAGWVYAHAGLLENTPICPACKLAQT